MALTPETLTRHELNGLPVRVADAANPDLVGIAGRVVVETANTLHADVGDADARRAFGLSTEGGARVKQVPKRDSMFEFALEEAPAAERPGAEGDAGSAVPAHTNETAASSLAAYTNETAGSSLPASTNEAAGVRKSPGSASELGSETAGERPRQSDPLASESTDATSSERASLAPDDCEGVVYVTVDGATLLSRPAERTERTGDSTWR